MSIRRLSPLFTWRSAIVDSGLPATARHVALTLSLHMSERGDSCFPKLATQVEETGLSRSTVQKQLALLEETGWLARSVGGGRGRATEYRAEIPPGSRALSQKGPADDEKGPSPDGKGPADGPPTESAIRTSGGRTTTPGGSRREKAVDKSKANGFDRRRRTALKDAIVRVCGWNPTYVTPDGWGRVEKAAKQLDETERETSTADLTEDIRSFGIFWRQKYEHTDLTPQAITNNWPSFRSGSLMDVPRKVQGRRR